MSLSDPIKDLKIAHCAITHPGCPEDSLLPASNKSNLEENCLFVVSVFLHDSCSYKALGAAVNFE